MHDPQSVKRYPKGKYWELDRRKQEHLVVPGPHDYPFNRGPGAIEMLLWHDRVLRGEAG
jgi:hypothetical protein